MGRQIVSTPRAARPPATYSQAVKAAGLVFVSGTAPADPATGSLVGITIQQNALKELDPTAPFEKSGHTVQAEADRLTKRRAGLRAIAGDFNKLFQKMSDKEIGDYFNQQKRLGEEMANRRALAR